MNSFIESIVFTVKSSVLSLANKIGGGSLNTTSQNCIDAINEVSEKVDNSTTKEEFAAYISAISKNLNISTDINAGDIPTLLLYAGYASIGRLLELYNHTGVLPDGSYNLTNARELLTGHSYSDVLHAIHIDNVGRKNIMLYFKQARNEAHAHHPETGSGAFFVGARDCSGEIPLGDFSSTSGTQTIKKGHRVLRTSNNHVYKALVTQGSINLGTEDYANTTNWYDLGSKVDFSTNDGTQNITAGMKVLNYFDASGAGLYQAKIDMPNLQLNVGDYSNETKWNFIGGYGNETIFTIDCLDLSTEGISATLDKYAIALTGRMGDANQARTIEPIYMYTKGISTTKQGAPALELYSLGHGGSCIELKNVATSHNYMFKAVNVSQQSNSGCILADNSGLSPAIAIISRGVNQPCVNAMRTDAVTYGDFLRYINETGNPIFQVPGDGKSIKMIDSVTGVLKTITVANGVLTVS